MEESITTTTIKSLLTQVSGIVNKYDEFAALTGENFNIFHILGLSTREVKLHSSLLAELLNPKGSHGMKDTFLKLFLQKLRSFDSVKDFDFSQTENATVEIEKWIGYLNEERTEGGYIDIYIKSSENKNIIIENKIYAGDQEGQLRRYHNFDKEATLVYLTLDGKEADDCTTKNAISPTDKINPILLSYGIHIKEWLEECKKEASNHPMLRETIMQYIYLIKHLTNQTMNENMKNELVKLISESPEYIRNAQEIAGVYNTGALYLQIVQNLKNPIIKIAGDLKLKCGFSGNALGLPESGFWFYKENWDYCIYFYFESIENMLVGVGNIPDNEKCLTEIKLKEYLKNFQMNNDRNDDGWFWGTNFKDWENTSWVDISTKIPNAKIPNAIRETTDTLLKKLEEFDKIRNSKS